MKAFSRQSTKAADFRQIGENSLLTSFPAEVRRKLASYFQSVSLPVGYFLYQPDQTVCNLYFPTTAVAVDFTMSDSGGSIQTAMIGREAIPALSPFLSGCKTKHFTQVLISGEFLKIDAQKVKDETSASPELQRILINLADKYIDQLSTAHLCLAFHQTEQRLCRWLVTLVEKCGDRLLDFSVTHQQIATLLGVHRPTLSSAAKNLERRKIISYSHGKLSILDFQQLQALMCNY